MTTAAIVAMWAAFIIGGWATISLLRSRRFMAGVLVLTSTVLLGVYGWPIFLGETNPPHEPDYFVYSLAFLCLFGTIYPAIPKSVTRERLRTYFYIGSIGLVVLLANVILENTGLPILLLVLTLITSIMVSYTIGTIFTTGYKTKKRRQNCGVEYAIWGAVALSHLLFYPALVLLFLSPTTCSDPGVLLGLMSGSLILAAIASLGVRSEGDYWQRLDKKPSSIINSSPHLFKALTYTPRKNRLL